MDHYYYYCCFYCHHQLRGCGFLRPASSPLLWVCSHGLRLSAQARIPDFILGRVLMRSALQVCLGRTRRGTPEPGQQNCQSRLQKKKTLVPIFRAVLCDKALCSSDAAIQKPPFSRDVVWGSWRGSGIGGRSALQRFKRKNRWFMGFMATVWRCLCSNI